LAITDLEEFTKILKLIPTSKLKEIGSYVTNGNISELNLMDMETSLSINSSNMKQIKKLFQNFTDGDIFSLLIETFLEKKYLEETTVSKLVVSSKTYHLGVSSTWDVIFKMLHNAQNKIRVVGYWVYEFPEFFKELQKIQDENEHPINIEFYFDDAKKWKNKILEDWPVGCRPKIFGINKKLDKDKKIKTLHAKMVIIDDKECLITSANLTKNAMQDNIEAGIWTIDKKIIQDSINVLKHFVTDGTLKQV
jgi:hypothetical protein